MLTKISNPDDRPCRYPQDSHYPPLKFSFLLYCQWCFIRYLLFSVINYWSEQTPLGRVFRSAELSYSCRFWIIL